MKEPFQQIAHEIVRSLAIEMGSRQGTNGTSPSALLDLLLRYLAREIVLQLENANSNKDGGLGNLQVGPEEGDGETEKEPTEEFDTHSEENGGSSLPNLKYAEPKYKNVDSVLKYIDKDEEGGRAQAGDHELQ